MQSSVAEATFMNEFTPYAMQALPHMSRTRQRFKGNDYSAKSGCPTPHPHRIPITYKKYLKKNSTDSKVERLKHFSKQILLSSPSFQEICN